MAESGQGVFRAKLGSKTSHSEWNSCTPSWFLKIFCIFTSVSSQDSLPASFKPSMRKLFLLERFSRFLVFSLNKLLSLTINISTFKTFEFKSFSVNSRLSCRSSIYFVIWSSQSFIILLLAARISVMDFPF